MNWTVEQLITGALAFVFGTGGTTILNAWWGRNRGKAQSETEARAVFTAEFNAIVAAQSSQLDRMDAQLAKISIAQEASERYIRRLVNGINDGTIPPIPPRNHDPSE